MNLSSLRWHVTGVRRTIFQLRRIFKHVVAYQVMVPTYLSGHYGLAFISDHIHPTEALLTMPPLNISCAGPTALGPRYYTEEVHVAAFALPKFVQEELAP